LIYKTDPIGYTSEDLPVMLSDIWPTDEEIRATLLESLTPEMFRKRYSDVLEEPRWDSIPTKPSALYPWDNDSTYVRLPSFFEGIEAEPSPIRTN